MQGIFQGFDILPGDVPLTAALDLTMKDSAVASLSLVWDFIAKSGSAAVIKP